MNRPDGAHIGTVRAKLVGLVVECQMGDNPEDCPLYEKRNLSFSDRIEWLKSLSDNEILGIYSAHRECLAAKLATTIDS